MNESTRIKKGDRVKATSRSKNDTAEFEVVVATSHRLESEYNVFDAKDWIFEVTLAAPEPLPTEPGIYSTTRADAKPVDGYRKLLLTRHGEWYWIDFTVKSTPPIERSVLEKIETSMVEMMWAGKLHPVWV